MTASVATREAKPTQSMSRSINKIVEAMFSLAPPAPSHEKFDSKHQLSLKCPTLPFIAFAGIQVVVALNRPLAVN